MVCAKASICSQTNNHRNCHKIHHHRRHNVKTLTTVHAVIRPQWRSSCRVIQPAGLFVVRPLWRWTALSMACHQRFRRALVLYRWSSVRIVMVLHGCSSQRLKPTDGVVTVCIMLCFCGVMCDVVKLCCSGRQAGSWTLFFI